MQQRQSHAPDSVYALADHLDAALAACEDLLEMNGLHADLEWFLASVRRFELAVILQVLRARQYAEELRGSGSHIAAMAALFLAGTLPFTETNGAQVNRPFDADASDASSGGNLDITDQFLIGRRVPIGTLVAMAGAFLDALEVTWVLYNADAPRTLAKRPALRPGPPPLPMVANNSPPGRGAPWR